MITLNPNTERQLAPYTRHSPQSLLLTGTIGVGLRSIALWLAVKCDVVTIYPIDTKGNTSASGTISVAAIRELYDLTRSKRRQPLTVIIDDADRMSRAAQTAFLKLLEEPTASTHFILTSHMPEHLLATIRSRAQHVRVQPITTEQTEDILAQCKKDSATTAQIRFIASGLPAELYRLIDDEKYLKARTATMTKARRLLEAPVYERLLIVQALAVDRSEASSVIDGMIAIIQKSVNASPQTSLIKKLDALLMLQENLRLNASPRLQLTQLVL